MSKYNPARSAGVDAGAGAGAAGGGPRSSRRISNKVTAINLQLDVGYLIYHILFTRVETITLFAQFLFSEFRLIAIHYTYNT